MHFDRGKEQTRILEQNIHNLAYAQYDDVDIWDIPMMHTTVVDNLKDIPIQGFNFALKETHPENIGVHFFLHDYQFERVWKYPDRYVEVLQKFKFVLSPDFSVYYDTPKVIQLFNVYRNRWCGRYWQDNGINVIPTVSIGNPELFDIFCAGVPKHSTIAISTIGDGRWGNYQVLKATWNMILDKLEPETILLYGKDLSNQLSGNIVYKKLISSKVAV